MIGRVTTHSKMVASRQRPLATAASWHGLWICGLWPASQQPEEARCTCCCISILLTFPCCWCRHAPAGLEKQPLCWQKTHHVTAWYGRGPGGRCTCFLGASPKRGLFYGQSILKAPRGPSHNATSCVRVPIFPVEARLAEPPAKFAALNWTQIASRCV